MTNCLGLNEALSQDIIRAVSKSLGETFGIEVTAAASEYGDGMVSLVGDISGIIGMVQSQLEGTLMLSVTFETMRDLLPKVVGNSVSITDEMAIDAVGELTNMIFGQIKTELNQRGHQLKLGIPCVVSGKGHFVSQFHRGKYMIVPFHLNERIFQVYIAVYQASNMSDRT